MQLTVVQEAGQEDERQNLRDDEYEQNHAYALAAALLDCVAAALRAPRVVGGHEVASASRRVGSRRRGLRRERSKGWCGACICSAQRMHAWLWEGHREYGRVRGKRLGDAGNMVAEPLVVAGRSCEEVDRLALNL